MGKGKQLEELKDEIMKQWKRKNVCFFGDGKNIEGCGDVKGFMGTDDIIFLGLNPTHGSFPTNHDKFLYKQLKNGFENAHITDLIKTRMTNKEIEKLVKNKNLKELLNEQLDKRCKFLFREIKIIKPKLIVTLGKKNNKKDNKFNLYGELERKDEFKKLKKKFNFRVENIIHYSSTRFPKNKDKFKKEIKRIKKQIFVKR